MSPRRGAAPAPGRAELRESRSRQSSLKARPQRPQSGGAAQSQPGRAALTDNVRRVAWQRPYFCIQAAVRTRTRRVLELARAGAVEWVRRCDPGRAGRPGSLAVAGRGSLISRVAGSGSADCARTPAEHLGREALHQYPVAGPGEHPGGPVLTVLTAQDHPVGESDAIVTRMGGQWARVSLRTAETDGEPETRQSCATAAEWST